MSSRQRLQQGQGLSLSLDMLGEVKKRNVLAPFKPSWCAHSTRNETMELWHYRDSTLKTDFQNQNWMEQIRNEAQSRPIVENEKSWNVIMGIILKPTHAWWFSEEYEDVACSLCKFGWFMDASTGLCTECGEAQKIGMFLGCPHGGRWPTQGVPPPMSFPAGYACYVAHHVLLPKSLICGIWGSSWRLSVWLDLLDV